MSSPTASLGAQGSVKIRLLIADDHAVVREGLVAILSVKLREPQFEGQTKTKLGNASMRSFVETTVNAQLAEWLEEHPTEARRIIQKSQQAAKARMAAKQSPPKSRMRSGKRGLYGLNLRSGRSRAGPWCRTATGSPRDN